MQHFNSTFNHQLYYSGTLYLVYYKNHIHSFIYGNIKPSNKKIIESRHRIITDKESNLSIYRIKSNFIYSRIKHINESAILSIKINNQHMIIQSKNTNNTKHYFSFNDITSISIFGIFPNCKSHFKNFDKKFNKNSIEFLPITKYHGRLRIEKCQTDTTY